jgi:hypothetical protein
MYLYYHIGQACINTATGFQCVLARPVLEIATGLELGQQHQSEQARQNLVSQTRGQAKIIFRQFDTTVGCQVESQPLLYVHIEINYREIDLCSHAILHTTLYFVSKKKTRLHAILLSGRDIQGRTINCGLNCCVPKVLYRP